MAETIERMGERLREGFEGAVIQPGVPDYDETRKLFNGMIDRRPALFAQCAGVGDVQRAIAYGRDAGFEIAVRGGGHGVAGRALSEGGLVIDLRRMNGVTVDPKGRTATVQGGATMGDLRPPGRTGSRRPADGFRALASGATSSAAATAGWRASSASPATACCQPTS
jgi:hypothetical protein